MMQEDEVKNMFEGGKVEGRKIEQSSANSALGEGPAQLAAWKNIFVFVSLCFKYPFWMHHSFPPLSKES